MPRIERNRTEEVVRAHECEDGEEEVRDGVSRSSYWAKGSASCLLPQHGHMAKTVRTLYEACEPDVDDPDDARADDGAQVRALGDPVRVMGPLDAEKDLGHDVVHAEELGERDEEAAPPGQDRERVEHEEEGDGRKRKNGEIDGALRERDGLDAAVVVEPGLDEPALERGDAFELGRHVARRLALLLAGGLVGASLDQALNARRVALDGGPVQ